MFKKILFLFYFFVAEATIAQDLTATQKMPSSADPGTDFTVEINIIKGTMNGFMKFYQELPAGYTASEIETRSGNFTFADGGVKIVWISPPVEESYTISYKVSVPVGVSGKHTLAGKISYIINNERKVFELEPATIAVGNIAALNTPQDNSIPPKEIPKTEAPKTEIVKTETPKKEEPKKENPPVPDQPTPPKAETKTIPIITENPKVPVSAGAQSSGKTYRVQIGAFNSKPKIDGVPDVSKVVLDNGITKYFSGNFSNYEEAVKRKKEMAEKGFQGAFIVSFENGKIVK